MGHKVLRSLLAPVYVFCGWLVLSRLLERKPPLWVLTYVVASALVLVPSPLIEPRCVCVFVLFHVFFSVFFLSRLPPRKGEYQVPGTRYAFTNRPRKMGLV